MRSRFHWRYLLSLGLLVLIAGLVALACEDEEEGAPGEAGEEPVFGEWGGVVIAPGGSIVVGFTGVLSGDLIALGTAALDSSKLAVQDLGDIQGFPVLIKEADDLCKAEGALPAAEILLAEQNLVAVLGSLCSGVNVAAQPRYEEAHLTQVSGASTAFAVTHPEGREPFQTFVRTVTNDGVQGIKQAEYATEVLQATTAYVANDTDSYGTGLKDVFISEFTRLGGTIAGEQGYEKGTTEFTALVTSIVNANPDLVYDAGFDPEGAALIRQLRAAGYTGAFLGGDGVRTEQFRTLAGPDAEGAYLSAAAPIEETPALLKFQEDFQTLAGYPWDDQPFTAQYYDAMTTIHRALSDVAVLFEDSLYVDLKALNEAIRAQQFAGVSGNISFDENGDVEAAAGKPQILFWKVEGGQYVQQEFE